MNETIELLKNHKSIREFNQIPITQEEENQIIAASQRGATAGNMMMYSITKIKNKDTINYLSKKCDNQSFMKKANLALLFVADSYKFNKYFISRGIPEEFPNFKNPCIADLFLALQDTIIAAQNSVIAAESLGIGTCYIGDILENKEEICQKFNLPKFTIPITLIVFGRYDYNPKLRSRFAEKHVIFNETYHNIDEHFINEMFKAEEEEKIDFAKKFYDRKINSDFLEKCNALH